MNLFVSMLTTVNNSRLSSLGRDRLGVESSVSLPDNGSSDRSCFPFYHTGKPESKISSPLIERLGNVVNRAPYHSGSFTTTRKIRLSPFWQSTMPTATKMMNLFDTSTTKFALQLRWRRKTPRPASSTFSRHPEIGGVFLSWSLWLLARYVLS